MCARVKLLPLIVMLAALVGCGGGGGGSSAPLQVPAPAGEQWTLVAPNEVGMDAGLLNRSVSELPDPSSHGLASMLVLRRGKPVLERYWNGYDKDTAHDLRSATKSITSLLVGIALDNQVLSSVNAPISDYLSNAYPGAPALKRDITLEHLLTMSSGLACNDWNDDSPGNENKMYKQSDWVQFILSLDSTYVPGLVNQYCTGGPVTLGRIMVEAGKQPIPSFAATKLFGPLGIASTSLQWADYSNHTQTDTGGHIRMRPRDMSKIGQLVLQGGQWNGQQVISNAWVTRSTSRHGAFSRVGARGGYGYLWWLSKENYKTGQVDVIRADGNGGQYIFIVPALDLVAVFTGENYDSDKANLPFQLLTTYVLAAVQQ